MLWIGFHFPSLALEALLRGRDSKLWHDEPWAIIGDRQVVVCNVAARKRGVRPGMPLSAAWAVAPALRILPRQRVAEQDALEGIATWLCRFTPRVTLQAPRQLAAEMGGSLRLFGGREQLEPALRQGLEQLGFSACLAWAPTARAALWGAAGGGAPLADLPVEVTGAAPDVLRLLRDLGVRTLGELMRLPRDGAARRLGPGLIDDLDRALGGLPDPCATFTPPARFAARLELPAQVTEAAGVLFAARRLLLQLEGFLVARQSGLREFVLTLRHPAVQPTRLVMRLAGASRNAAHFTTLLQERLMRLELVAPVEAIRLEARRIEPLCASTGSLFQDAGDSGEGWGPLIERLVARLGETAVHGLAIQDEHRPEKASQTVAPGALSGEPVHRTPQAPARGARPVWLLETPRRLAENTFVLLAGPERIESGWWDDDEVRRDYFVARTGEASLVWIFRDREGGWFLHGIFA